MQVGGRGVTLSQPSQPPTQPASKPLCHPHPVSQAASLPVSQAGRQPSVSGFSGRETDRQTDRQTPSHLPIHPAPPPHALQSALSPKPHALQSAGSLKVKLDALPPALGLSSRHTRELLTRCPHLLRRSPSVLHERVQVRGGGG